MIYPMRTGLASLAARPAAQIDRATRRAKPDRCKTERERQQAVRLACGATVRSVLVHCLVVVHVQSISLELLVVLVQIGEHCSA